jgi:hypothetical protein
VDLIGLNFLRSTVVRHVVEITMSTIKDSVRALNFTETDCSARRGATGFDVVVGHVAALGNGKCSLVANARLQCRRRS